MPRRRLRGVRPAVEHLDRHALHQRGDMQAPGDMLLGQQQALQHAAAGEGVFQMQPSIRRIKVGGRNRMGQIMDAARLTPSTRACRSVADRARDRSSHCAQKASLAGRARRKIILQRQLPDLRMQCLHIDRGHGSLGLRLGTEDTGGPFKKLAALLRHLVGVNIELLGQFSQRLLAPDRRQRDLRLESRAMVPAQASRHIRSCSRQSCRVQAENPPAPDVQISRASSLLSKSC